MIGKLKLRNNRGFTILELLISMTLFALITTSVLLAVESLSIARIKTLNRVALLEELYFFSEQLFTGIKEGGTLDYEEYWNRQAVDVTVQSGSYIIPTGVGNYGMNGDVVGGTDTYGTGIYLCRSGNGGTNMGSGGCLTGNNNGGIGNQTGVLASPDFSGAYQRYGEYAAQFTDYNGNADADLGDEDVLTDASKSIIGDDDDRSIGDVSEVLTGSMQELYLIDKESKKRTFFRWRIQQDPNATFSGTFIPCVIDTTTVPGKIITGSGCMGNIQVLKLRGLDVGFSHSGDIADKSAYDGIVDTWVCAEDGQCNGPLVASTTKKIATGIGSEWFDLFPSSINVKNLSFRIYPVKDPWKSWAAPDCSVASCISPFIHPYVRMNLEMGFSWGKRRAIKNDDPTISISTSVSLSDFE